MEIPGGRNKTPSGIIIMIIYWLTQITVLAMCYRNNSSFSFDTENNFLLCLPSLVAGLTLIMSLGLSPASLAQESTKPDNRSITIHPVIETAKGEFIFSREHTFKKHLEPGDQLARDFVVVTSDDRGIVQLYEGDGLENKDYTSWRKQVLAPVSGEVLLVNHPQSTNKPGKMNREAEPGRIYIENEDGVTVSLVHVREIRVDKGQTVSAGEAVAKVGNNGNSTGPHVHVGAWKQKTPYQIRVNLYAGQ